jgi:hypothetical protein
LSDLQTPAEDNCEAAPDIELILASLGPARKFADPSSPVEGRLMAARGALPLPPQQIASVLFVLTLDPEAEVKEKAGESLANLPDRVIDATLSAAIHPAVLAWCAPRFEELPERLEQIALNAATSDETFCMLAALPHRRIVDIAAANQPRLLRCPALVDALSENPAASQSTLDRVLEFLGVDVGDAAKSEEPLPEVPEPLANTADPDAAPIDVDDESDLPPELTEDSDEEVDEKALASLSVRIDEMSVIEKIKLARFGNAEARSLLVRDRNKLVASAAVRSPKLTESEAITFAKARNVCDEVLRIISNSREWTKSYQVKMAIVSNPKSPLGTAIKFLNYLTDRDLRGLMRSRDVPGQISTHARRILGRKGKL